MEASSGGNGTAPEQAVQELLEVSPQVETAIVTDRKGTPLASSIARGGGDSPTKLGSMLVKLLDQAERSRTELGREPVTQCEVGTGTGNVFVVGDSNHIVAAITGPEPTVGLVFYDLKTALRSVREAAGGDSGGSRNGTASGAAASKGAQS